MNRILLTIAICFTSQLAFAGSSLERITLVLTGTGCQASNEIEKAFNGLDGVRAVDGRSIPGHVLVDIERGRVTGAELVHHLAALENARANCHASVMESCITAEHPQMPSSVHNRRPIPLDGQ